MERSTIEIDVTAIVVDFLVLAVNFLVVLLFLCVAAYLLVGVPLILYLSNALDRRTRTD